MAGWNNIRQQLGGQAPASWANNGQNRQQDIRQYTQQQSGRRRVGNPKPQGEYTTQTTSPGWQNTDTRDQTWQQWQDTVGALGGSPMSYYDYANANNGGTAMPTTVNGIRMEAAPGTINPGAAAVTTTDPATFGAPEPVTVTQTWAGNQGGGGNRNNRNNNRNRR